jgi:hypothetical protein
MLVVLAGFPVDINQQFLPSPFGSGGICRFVRSLEAIHPVEIVEQKEREREKSRVMCMGARMGDWTDDRCFDMGGGSIVGWNQMAANIW